MASSKGLISRTTKKIHITPNFAHSCNEKQNVDSNNCRCCDNKWTNHTVNKHSLNYIGLLIYNDFESTLIGCKHGRPQKFFQEGEQHRHFACPFSGCKRCNANRPSQNALPLLHHKEISLWKHELSSHYFEIVFSIQVELHSSLRKGCTFCRPLQALKQNFNFEIRWKACEVTFVSLICFRLTKCICTGTVNTTFFVYHYCFCFIYFTIRLEATALP